MSHPSWTTDAVTVSTNSGNTLYAMIAQPSPPGHRSVLTGQAGPAGSFTRLVATLALFTGLAGGFWRDFIGWWGWGALAAAIVVTSIVLLTRRRRVSLPPVWLGLFLVLIIASVGWSDYRAVTVLADIAQLSTTAVGAFLALALSWAELVRALANALRWIVGLSLLFELVVSLLVRHQILPFWTNYGPGPHPEAFYWSRNVLLHGGRIQGIVGNSNILGMCALLAVIVFGAQLADGAVRRMRGVSWLVAAALCVVLTRSSTVVAAAFVVLLAFVFAVWCRHRPEEHRRRVYVTAAASAVAAILAVLALRGPLLALLGKTDTLTGRTVIWHSVAQLARQRPAFGWGWTSYWAPWVKPFKGLAVQDGVEYLQAHDAWLDVWMQVGIVGLVIFAALCATTLWRLWFLAVDSPKVPAAHGDTARRALALVPFLIFVAYLAQSLAESRLLIEGGWMLLVAFSLKSAQGQIDPGPGADAPGDDARRLARPHGHESGEALQGRR
ncbi:MAG TPA: O-antigen ligase family protein [Microbacteriaceae bacterium]|nr:O-antigen ligase family protein [Microbacteriaceae bacterium]